MKNVHDNSKQELTISEAKNENSSSSQEPVKNLNTEELSNKVITSAPSQKKYFWYFLILIVFGVIGVTGWKTFTSNQTLETETEEQMKPPASLPVKVTQSQIKPIEAWVFNNGEVAAVRFKHLTFETAGTINYIKKIAQRDLREGDMVKEGELLAKIDQRKLNADITIAKANQLQAQKGITNAKANLKQAKSSVLREKANLAQAEQNLAKAQADLSKAQTRYDFALTDFNRYQDLVDQGVIQRREVEVRKTKWQDAQADLEAAKAGVKLATSQIQAAQTQIDAAESIVIAALTQVESAQSAFKSATAQLNKSNVILEDTVLTAPFNGIVAYLNIREGDYWSPQVLRTNNYQEIVESVPIVVVDPSKLEVNLELPTFDGSRVNTGQRAYIIRDADLTQASLKGMNSKNLIELAQAKGDIFAVNPAVTPGGRAVNARIRITNGKERLRVGERVSVWIAVEYNPRAIVVPRGSILVRDRQAYAFVVDKANNTVEQRQVELGIEGLAYQEIKAGVLEGELVVTEGKNRLVNGSSVRLVGTASK